MSSITNTTSSITNTTNNIIDQANPDTNIKNNQNYQNNTTSTSIGSSLGHTGNALNISHSITKSTVTINSESNSELSKEQIKTTLNLIKTENAPEKQVVLPETPLVEKQITDAIKENTTIHTPKTEKSNEINTITKDNRYTLTVDYDTILQKLDTYGNSLGKNANTLNKRFLGISYEACQANILNALRHKWSPKFFWNICAKIFNVNQNHPPKYNNIYGTIKALKYVQDNYNKLHNLFEQSPQQAIKLFEQETGMLWHASDNTPDSFFINIEIMANVLDTLMFPENHPDVSFTDNKKPTDLEVFQNAFDETNCCFPARQRKLIDFFTACTSTDFQTIPDYNSNDDTTTLLDKTSTYLTNIRANPNSAKLIKETVISLANQLESDGGKANVDMAAKLKKITYADIAKYQNEVLWHGIEDLDITAKHEGKIYTFPDGSTLDESTLQ